MQNELFARIENITCDLSKGQVRIAEYIINNSEKAAFMTAHRLGDTVGVSESTVVRFADRLGYEGYPEFQHALQDEIKTKLTSVQRIELANNAIGNSDILEKIMNSDAEKIRSTLDNIDRTAFHKAVESILSAEMVYILGVRSSSALSGFLGFYLRHILENVKLIINASGSEMFEQIMRINEKDAVIGISFPRYSSRTVKAIKYARDKGASVVAITDSEASPIAQNADYALYARSDMLSFVDSLTAPLSLINALIVALALKRRESVYSTFEELEHIWDEYGVYEKHKGEANE